MKILLIDDDEISRLVLSSLLKRIPGVMEVMEAVDGEEAWDKILGGLRPDLCCCDLVMPNLDGVGLLMRVRADARLSELPFVMISSAADRNSVSQAAQAGANGFIAKPYTGAVVTRTVVKVLRESLERNEESAADTRQRLGISVHDLAGLTQRLSESIEKCAVECDAGMEKSAQDDALRRLGSSCATLGMLRCARLLELGVGSSTGLVSPALLLREAAQMLDARSAALSRRQPNGA